MITKSDALNYLEEKIRNDRPFAARAFAELLFKTCAPAKLKVAVDDWLSGDADDNANKPQTPSNGPEL